MKTPRRWKLSRVYYDGMWEPISIEPKKLYESQIGELAILLQHGEPDWFLAQERKSTASRSLPLRQTRKKIDNIKAVWQRWASGREELIAQLLPLLPDRPVVARPESPLKIPVAHEALFYVNVPIWIRVAVGGNCEIVLSEFPSVILSKTWFGDTISGEPCYALKTRATRNTDVSKPTTIRATCPVQIKNDSMTELPFDRICLHVENLSLFLADDRLWTNTITVTYRGQDQLSQIGLSTEPQGIVGKPRLVSGPRVHGQKGIVKKSFHFLKMLTGLDQI